jgi:predicted DNA-binding transcriptional regulator AlpA
MNAMPSSAPSRYLPPEEAARFLGLSKRTLAKYRVVGGGPVYAKLGRRVVYALDDLQDWADRRRRDSTSSPARPRQTAR